jgi:hypothetical protein
MALPLLAMGALPCVTFTIIVCKCCREQALRANTRFVCRVLAAQILLFQGSQPPVKKTAQNYQVLVTGHSHCHSNSTAHHCGLAEKKYKPMHGNRRLTCDYNHQSHHLLLGGAAAVGSAHACA